MQTVTTDFENASKARKRELIPSCKVAWTKERDEDLGYAQIDISQINGPDVIVDASITITEPDTFVYFDETNYITQLDVTRQITEPIGSINYAYAGFSLTNITGRYNDGSDPDIGDYILSKRIAKLGLGFEYDATQETVQLIAGITETPKLSGDRKTLTIEMYDYINIISDLKTDQALIFENVTGDEIITSLLLDAGFSLEQLDFDTAINTYDFVFIDENENVSDVIKKLCEAEEANFYQDELGVIRFVNRLRYLESPYNSSVWTINSDRLINEEDIDSTNIINSCTVNSSPYVVGTETKELYSNTNKPFVGGNSSVTIIADFSNPAYSLEDFDIVVSDEDTDIIVNTEEDNSGTELRFNFDVTVTNYYNKAFIELTNNGGTGGYVTKLRLRGIEATKQDNLISVTVKNEDSITNFDEQTLEVNNPYIDTEGFAQYLASSTVNKYSGINKRKRITIRGIPQLQLQDRITMPDLTEYRIVKITDRYNTPSYLQILEIREITQLEASSPFRVDFSQVDGYDVIVP